jgi:hypothetical protein
MRGYTDLVSPQSYYLRPFLCFPRRMSFPLRTSRTGAPLFWPIGLVSFILHQSFSSLLTFLRSPRERDDIKAPATRTILVLISSNSTDNMKRSALEKEGKLCKLHIC